MSVAVRAAVALLACCLAVALAWQVGRHGAGALASGTVWAGVTLLSLSAFGAVRSAVRLWRGLGANRAIAREVRQRRVAPAAEEIGRAHV